MKRKLSIKERTIIKIHLSDSKHVFVNFVIKALTELKNMKINVREETKSLN